MGSYKHIWAKSDGTPLIEHLREVARTAEAIALHVGLDPQIAVRGAHLHDIGKVSPIFQKRLRERERQPGSYFRHEFASLFFLSLIPSEEERRIAIHMIAAHHKSILGDISELGFLDLYDRDLNCIDRHIREFEMWSADALGILEELGWEVHAISEAEARKNIEEAEQICSSLSMGCSQWKGVLMAADHLASAMTEQMNCTVEKLFIKPDLFYYAERQSELYPLSLISTDDTRLHTLVTAPTGAGKTDFLLRRCRGRVFYTLPFQASINAMYDRLKTDLSHTEAQIYPLHAASVLKLNDKYERILSHHVGASIKVLTPHQIAAVAFALKGYEAITVDLQGCDVILDEIHTYTDVAQAMVQKIVEVLLNLGCRVHIGTATMPSALKNRLLDLLGGREQVYEVQLTEQQLNTYDRHTIHKVVSVEETENVISQAIEKEQKVLFVCNQVKRAQELFTSLREQYPGVPKMLLHSRFKRKDRSRLESELREVFNQSNEACIVVSTQVVEVSLDISFDLMVTECAPIDALIQRFGRINRKRTLETIGSLKPIYVIAPPEEEDAAKPYDKEVLHRSFDALPNDAPLHEVEVKNLLDCVYPDVQTPNIDWHSAFEDGRWTVLELAHRPKSVLLDLLEIDSACCVTEEDEQAYREGNFSSRTVLEIPVTQSIRRKGLTLVKEGAYPYLLPDVAYDPVLGYIDELATPFHYRSFEIL